MTENTARLRALSNYPPESMRVPKEVKKSMFASALFKHSFHVAASSGVVGVLTVLSHDPRFMVPFVLLGGAVGKVATDAVSKSGEWIAAFFAARTAKLQAEKRKYDAESK